MLDEIKAECVAVVNRGEAIRMTERVDVRRQEIQAQLEKAKAEQEKLEALQKEEEKKAAQRRQAVLSNFEREHNEVVEENNRRKREYEAAKVAERKAKVEKFLAEKVRLVRVDEMQAVVRATPLHLVLLDPSQSSVQFSNASKSLNRLSEVLIPKKCGSFLWSSSEGLMVCSLQGDVKTLAATIKSCSDKDTIVLIIIHYDRELTFPSGDWKGNLTRKFRRCVPLHLIYDSADYLQQLKAMRGKNNVVHSLISAIAAFNTKEDIDLKNQDKELNLDNLIDDDSLRASSGAKGRPSRFLVESQVQGVPIQFSKLHVCDNKLMYV